MEPLRLECQHFLECIATRHPPRTDAREALRVLQVLNACQTVLEEGRPVSLSPEPPGWTEIEAGYFVHPSAEVDPDVIIGQGTKIWRHSYLMTGTRIGERCNVGQNVVVGPNVTVGNGCKIQNNVSVYEGVTLEDDVFCGPSMVFTNVINPRSHIPRRHEIRPTLVKRGATIGANATILCGHTLGEYCFVGAGAVVTKNVPAYALVMGNPAKQTGWMCACGMRLFDDLKCYVCGAEYNQLEADLSPAD
ncbi:MAG: hypothetical protein HQK57_07085 [Deltaproteobacteria bacterium]|nr:hypothetical protein [Deltaproteobacteria bacterium]